MSAEPNIALDCPYCHASIYAAPDWFKQPYGTCPHCEQGLAAGQFAEAIAALEQAMDDRIDEMLYDQPHSCCGKSSCGTKGDC